MRRALSTAAWMLAFGSIVLSAVPALAGFGAVAYDVKTGHRGWSWNQSTMEKAVEVALSKCGTSDCKVLTKINSKRCAALATTEDGKGWGASARATVDAARLAALANCQKTKLGECIVRVSDCNK
jgi:hypothetical protein